jgi:hypothetical protein
MRRRSEILNHYDQQVAGLNRKVEQLIGAISLSDNQHEQKMRNGGRRQKNRL